MKRVLTVFAMSFVYLQPHGALASTYIQPADINISLGVSTLGAGGTLGIHPLSSRLGARFEVNLLHFNINLTSSGSRDKAQANLQNESLIADYYPWRGAFRISGGVVFNQNSAAFSSTPEITGALLGFLTRTHYKGVVGNVHGPISFNPIAPYLGFGWDYNFHGPWSFSADMGAMYQGNGRIALVPTNLIASNARMRAGLIANAQKADRMIDKMSFYPIIGFQFEYRF